jgi:hypothetical protein
LGFQGEVVGVAPRVVRMFNVDFSRADTIVICDTSEVVLPTYVEEHLFKDEWRPEVGQYVSGALWLKAHL